MSERAYQPHDFKGWAQRYDRITRVLHKPDLRTGKVRGANCQLLRARPLQKAAREAMKTDPFFFVEAMSAPQKGEL
jgi:hypothetical protein